MGNLQVRGYKATSKDHFTGGTQKLWRVYPASKESTNQKASIFLFEASKYGQYKLNKEAKARIIDTVRKEASNLAKYMHAAVLKLYEPLYEKNDLAFVTEPVVCTLSDILEGKSLERLASNDINLKLILLELLQGLSYLAEVDPLHPRRTLSISTSVPRPSSSLRRAGSR